LDEQFDGEGGKDTRAALTNGDETVGTSRGKIRAHEALVGRFAMFQLYSLCPKKNVIIGILGQIIKKVK
jgi:hypothetical protein